MTPDQVRPGYGNPHHALYCRRTGRRLPPQLALEEVSDAPRAVAVFDDGLSLSLFGDSVFGRDPHRDLRVVALGAAPVTVTDPTKQISRCHVLLRFQRWQIEVIDLGSSNGTSISAPGGQWEPVVPGVGARIDNGQQVRMASRVFTVHFLRT
jgi:hypothetical protein